MVAEEIFELCARRPGIRFARATYAEDPPPAAEDGPRPDASFVRLKLGAARPPPQFGLLRVPPAKAQGKSCVSAFAHEDHDHHHTMEGHVFPKPSRPQGNRAGMGRDVGADADCTKRAKLHGSLEQFGRARSRRRVPPPPDEVHVPCAAYDREETLAALEAHAVVDLEAGRKAFTVPKKGCLRIEVKSVPRLFSQLELINRDGLAMLNWYLRENTASIETTTDLVAALTTDHRFLCKQVQALIDALGCGATAARFILFGCHNSRRPGFRGATATARDRPRRRVAAVPRRAIGSSEATGRVIVRGDRSRRHRDARAGPSEATGRSDAPRAGSCVRGGASVRGRSCLVRERVAAPPRLPRGYSVDGRNPGVRVEDGNMAIVRIFTHLLPRVIDTDRVEALVDHNLSIKQRRELHRMLGSFLPPLFNSFNGHYCLDLAHPVDRRCAWRLAAYSFVERCWCRAVAPSHHDAGPEGPPALPGEVPAS